MTIEMNAHRYLSRLVLTLTEESLKHFHHELHGRVIVVMEEYRVPRGFFQLGLGFRDLSGHEQRPSLRLHFIISIGSMENRPDSLARQLENARFERAFDVVESLALHRALLTTAELARVNIILTGSRQDDDPWRREPVTLVLPNGKKHDFALITDPLLTTRETLHRATALAESGGVVNAAVDVYAGLVMSHMFRDGNRRTAALAAHYFLKRYGVPLSGLAIHEIGLGDLREPGQIELLRETVQQMAKFVTRGR